MNNIFKYIFGILTVSIMSSCMLDEPFEPVKDTSTSREIEFVARPTNFVKTNVSTKATSEGISAIESKVYNAFFLLYDGNGNLFRYENLTSTITDSGTVPSQKIITDNSLTDVTVCYVANLPEKTIAEYMVATAEEKAAGTTDLSKFRSLVIKMDYDESMPSGCVGVPMFDLDGKISTPKVSCIPMLGVWKGNLTGLSAKNTIEIPVKRLFAKIGFTVALNVNLSGEDAGGESYVPSMDFEYFTVHNLPNRVSLFPTDQESAWVTQSSSWFKSYTIPNGDVSIDNGESVTFYFYVPEYLVEPYLDQYLSADWYEDEANRQRYKPLLVNHPSGNKSLKKKATYVEFLGVLSKKGQDMTNKYTIYLGGDNFSDLSMKRNVLYNNTITIYDATRGDSEDMMGVDHRVNVTYGGFLVGFQRATLLDSHYEVRPLRVKFPKNFIEENQDNPGTLTVEILKDASGNMPGWVRLERPTKTQLNAQGAPYCLTGDNYNHTKRKYFTVDLINTLINNTSVSYNPFASSTDDVPGDLNGDVPVWVYIDEYTAVSSDDYSDTDVRSAVIRVKYTPGEGGGETIYQDFTVRQRAIYPIQATGWDGVDRKFGIEYFEEYLHDYDSQDNYGAEGGNYYTSQDGIQWGFDGAQFSKSDQALYFTGDGGYININDIANEATAGWNLYYDFYLDRDRDSDEDEIIVHDYSGYNFNQKLIAQQKVHTNIQTLSQQAMTALEYCYNKNKRNSDGTVVKVYNSSTVTNDEYVHHEYYAIQKKVLSFVLYTEYYDVTWKYNSKTTYTYEHTVSDNLKWFLPAIDELEDIVVNGINHDYFSEVFVDNLYWSSQPAYDRNYFQYIIGVDDAGGLTSILKTLGIPTRQKTYGVYMSDNLLAARATKYDPTAMSFISSDINGANIQEGYLKGTTLYGTFSVDNIKETPGSSGDFYVYDLLNTFNYSLNPISYSITWHDGDKVAATTYKTMDGKDIVLPEGIQSRDSKHRVRCIYMPTPPSETKVLIDTKHEDMVFVAGSYNSNKEGRNPGGGRSESEYTIVDSVPTEPQKLNK